RWARRAICRCRRDSAWHGGSAGGRCNMPARVGSRRWQAGARPMADEAVDPAPPTASTAAPAVAHAAGGLRRWLPRLGVVVLALGGSALAWSCFAHGDRSSYTAPVARLAAASAGVTYLPRGHLYIVAQPDGSLLALDEA